MRKSTNFLRAFAFLFTLIFSTNSFAAGYTCPSSMKYTSCNEGYYMTDTGMGGGVGCDININPGLANATPGPGNACTQCSSWWAMDTNAVKCTGGTACPVFTCPAGKYWGGYACEICTSGSFCTGLDKTYSKPAINAGLTSCSTATSGNYPLSDGGTSSTSISSCYVILDTGKYIAAAYGPQVTCLAGSYCPGGTSYPIYYGQTGGIHECPVDYRDGGTDIYNESSCMMNVPAGKYMPTTSGGVAAQVNCTAGNYCPAKSVGYNTETGAPESYTVALPRPCPTGYTSDANAGSESECYIMTTAGKYIATAGATEVPCVGGSFCPGGVKVTYGNTGGATSCSVTLGAGYTSAGGITDTTNTKCYLPVAEKKVRSGTSGTTLVDCANGTYKGAHDEYYGTSYSCDSCTNKPNADATYTDNAATNACPWTLTCAAGTYWNYTSKTCATCPAGSYCPETTVDDTTNTDTGAMTCPDGYKAATNPTLQSECALVTTAGKYVVTAGAGEVPCVGGSYCPGGVTVTYIGTGGATACSTLGANYTSDGGITATANTNCYLNVANKKVRNGGSGTTLVDCAIGTFKAAHKAYYGTTYTCDACSNKPDTAEYTGNAATNACPWSQTCAAGTYWNNTSKTCVDCIANSFCIGATATQATAANTGLTACSTQGNGTYTLSDTKATSSENCRKTFEYKGNGANGGTAPTAPSSCNFGKSCVAPSSGFTYTGKDFTAWFDGTTNFKTGDSLVNAASTAGKVTLTAQWSTSSATCSAGYYMQKATTSCNTPCPKGSYCPGGATYSYNATNDQGLTACSTLGTGYTSDGGESAKTNTACYLNVAEKKVRTGTSGTALTNCANGTFMGAHKAYYGTAYTCSACTGLPTGGSWTGNAATDSCPWELTCAAGTYWNNTSKTCVDCIANSFCIGATATQATAANTGLTACSTQGNGTYRYSPAKAKTASECYKDVVYSAGGGTGTGPTSPNKCYYGIECKAPALNGTFTYVGRNFTGWVDGSSTSVAVGALLDSLPSNASNQIVLTAQWSTNSYTCAAGKYLPAGATACVECTTGSFCTGGSYPFNGTLAQGITACSTLGTGYTSDGGTQANANTSCYLYVTSAKVRDGADGTTVINCATGMYKSEHKAYYGTVYTCSACTNKPDAATYTGNAGANICPWTLTCDAGTYWNSSTRVCTPCPTGSFCPGTTVTDDTGGISLGQTSCSTTTGGAYPYAAANATSSADCYTQCAAGMYVKTKNNACEALTINDKYIGEHSVYYGNTSSAPSTCPTGWNITGKTNAADHASINSCYQTCSTESIEPPVGAVKEPKNATENYPRFCVYEANCPGAYEPMPSGDFYDDSGFTTDPICATTAFQVTFMPNGGSISTGGTSYTKTCTVGAACVLNDTKLTEFIRSGYAFGGWAKTAGGAAVYQNGMNIVGLEETSLNLYAVWDGCAPGYVWDGGTCTLCPAGTWKSGTSNASGAAASCNSCGGGKTSPAGSSSAAACTGCPAGYFCGEDGGLAISCPAGWDETSGSAKTEADCFKNCPSYPVTYGTAIAVNAKEFYDQDCQYSCVSDTGNIGEVVGGVCIETSCAPNYEMVGNTCEPCDRENALSYKINGNCEIEYCVAGYHPNGQVCEEDVVECEAPNAIEAYKTWNHSKKAFGACQIKECEGGYHISSNACVLDEGTCTVANGSGYREWNTQTNTWGECIVTYCNPGYTSDPAETNDLANGCGVCKNAYSVLGERAVSSFASGCEIAACMYQGELYNLDGNECVPICDVNGYEDETGTMKWNPSTKKCVRQCKEGFSAW